MISLINRNHWLIEQAERSGDLDAVVTNGGRISYKRLLQLSLNTGSYLKEQGVGENDRVAISADHNEKFVIVINALWLIGALPVPMNPQVADEEFLKMLEKARCNYHITFQKQSNKFENIKSLLLRDLTKLPDALDLQVKRYEPQSKCTLLFTSGSTGDPKCVTLSFDNIFESVKSVDTFINHSKDDIWLSSLPFYHIGGLSIIFRSIISGCLNAIPNSLSRAYLNKDMAFFRPTLISLVDTMMKNILKDLSQPWEGLRHIFLGGGPISDDIIKQSLRKNWPISLVYGSTETSSMVTICSNENLRKNGVSAGAPLTGVNISIKKNIDRENSGIIVVTSKSVSPGYFFSAKNESSRIVNGQFYSNDIGRFDQNGNLNVLGRVDNMIISGGENISLSEIRKVLRTAFDENDFLILPIKDIKWGQSYIIIADKRGIDDSQKVINLLRKRVSKYKYPKDVAIFDNIPRNKLGKVKLNEIKKRLNFDFL